MTIDLTAPVQAVIALISALISAYVIPWLKRKISAEKLAEVSVWVEIAVNAAEQLYAGGGRGAEKKSYVIQFLRHKDYAVDTADIGNMIEAAVHNLPPKLRGD